MPTFTPLQSPDFDFKRQVKPTILRAEFGDSYSQRGAKGINNQGIIFAVTWTHLTLAERDDIVNFFDARNGFESFDYTIPDEGSPRKFIVEQYSDTYTDFEVYIVTARFREVFDL